MKEDRGFPAKFYATTEKNAFYEKYKVLKFHPIEKVHEREVSLSLQHQRHITHNAPWSEFAKGLKYETIFI